MKKSLITIILILTLIVGFSFKAEAARTGEIWVERFSSHVELVWNEGRDILIRGVNKYLNFGSTSGSGGYGFRDSGGTMEFKNSGGDWTEFGTGSGGSSLWATSTNESAIYPLSSRAVVVGDTATSSDGIFEVNGDSTLEGNLNVIGSTTAEGLRLATSSADNDVEYSPDGVGGYAPGFHNPTDGGGIGISDEDNIFLLNDSAYTSFMYLATNIFQIESDSTQGVYIGSKDGATKFGAYNSSSQPGGLLDFSNITSSDKTFTFPNASGTVALTDDLYTSSDFDTDFAANDTDDLSEGTTNLYSQWEETGSDIYYDSGNVGIGTSSPSEDLDILDETDNALARVISNSGFGGSIVHSTNFGGAAGLVAGGNANFLFNELDNFFIQAQPLSNVLSGTGTAGGPVFGINGSTGHVAIGRGNNAGDVRLHIKGDSANTGTNLIELDDSSDVLQFSVTDNGDGVFEGALDSTTLNTGQGDNELYAMDQDVQTSDSPTFSGLTLSSLTNCDTIDTDGSGVLSCGTDASGGGGLATTSPFTAGDLVQVSDSGTVNSIATSSLGLDTDDISEGSNLYFTDERAEDAAGGMFSGNTETLITATYQDGDGTVDLVVDNDLSNYDNSTSGFFDASSDVNHDSTTGFVSNEHIDHSSVSVSGGTGLSGGGDITTSRTLNLDINSLTNRSAFTSGDKLAIYEDGVGIRKVDYDDLPGAGGGLTSLNGETGDTQTFATSTSADTFTIDSSSNTHTFTIPSNLGFFTNDSGYITDYTVTEADVTQHEGAIDHDALTNFVANEHIDWTADQGATDINDANIAETAVTQHESALTITESQISDLNHTTDTNLTEEEVQDFAWNTLGGTQTLIDVTYQDGTDDVDFVVDNDLSNYDNSTSGFITDANDSVSGSELDNLFSQNGFLERTGANTYQATSTIDISDDTNLSGDSEIVLTDDALSIDSSIARDSELHNAVTLAGTNDYISLSGQEITRNVLDFSDDTNATDGDGITFSGDSITADLGTAIDTTEITNDTILEVDLDATNAPSDDQILSFDNGSGGFTWVDDATGGGGAGDDTIFATTTLGSTETVYVQEFASDFILGSNATTTAGFWFDDSATTTHIGSGGAGDSVIEFAIDSVSKWVLGADDDDSDNFVISSGDTLGTNNMLEINSNRVVTTHEERVISTTIASTSPEFTSGGSLPAGSDKDGYTLTEYRCWVEGGTSVVINLSDGTNDTETITCGTSVTSDTNVSTNDTFSADEKVYMEFGTVTGSVQYLHFEAYADVTR